MAIEIIKDRSDPSFTMVIIKINGEEIDEVYSFNPTVDDATIDAEVQTDLTNKGYTW